MDKRNAIEEYFRCYKDRDRETLQKILAPKLIHKSPWASYDDRDQMLDEIWEHVGKTWATDLKIYSDGSEYIVHYKHNKQGAELVEKFSFEGGMISRIDVYPEYQVAD